MRQDPTLSLKDQVAIVTGGADFLPTRNSKYKQNIVTRLALYSL
jgi:hypothetical protein